jgi:hypothetical protein
MTGGTKRSSALRRAVVERWRGLGWVAVLAGALVFAGEARSDSRARPSETIAQSHKAKRIGRRRHRRAAVVSPAYRRMRSRWHRREAALAAAAPSSSPALVLLPIHGNQRYVLTPNSVAGGFAEAECAKAAQAFAARDGAQHEIHPRLLDLMYRAQRRFAAPFVYIVSGYRHTRSTSRHSQGRAVDMVLPGTRDRVLAEYLRKQGFVGVGIYPVSGFVHLDVRDSSFFWSDGSGPGRSRRRVRPMGGGRAQAADAQARARGEVPTSESEALPDMEMMSDESGTQAPHGTSGGSISVPSAPRSKPLAPGGAPAAPVSAPPARVEPVPSRLP